MNFVYFVVKQEYETRSQISIWECITELEISISNAFQNKSLVTIKTGVYMIKKIINIIFRIVIYLYVIFMIGLIPYFFINYSGEKMKTIAESSTLKLHNENNNNQKEITNEKTKCRNCPHANKCNNSKSTESSNPNSDSKSGTTVKTNTN